MNQFPYLALSFALFLMPLSAQDEPAPDQPRKPFWEASLSDGGKYTVRVSSITSVSKHIYLLDGGLVVTEVTIDTSGNSLVRFYHISPLGEDSAVKGPSKVLTRGQELLNQASQRTGVNAANMAQKTYPQTTHARTIEYRILDKEQLEKLYQSAHKTWVNSQSKATFQE